MLLFFLKSERKISVDALNRARPVTLFCPIEFRKNVLMRFNVEKFVQGLL